MQLAALKIGIGVPAGDFAGTVRSAFRRACLIATDGAALVTLVAGAGGLPGGIIVAAGDDFDFTRATVEGTRIGVRAGIVRFENARLGIDLRGAVPWRSRLDRLKLSLGDPGSRTAWPIAARILAADGRAAALRALAGDAIDALVAAGRQLDAAAANEAAASLVGLGAGGTPAGDDFLVGFLAALHAAKPRRGMRAFAAELSRGIGHLADRTNDVSRVYLLAAAGGEVSERLTDLAAAIAQGAEAETAAAASAAIAVGHSSGADGTLGLLAGALVSTAAPVAGEMELFDAAGG